MDRTNLLTGIVLTVLAGSLFATMDMLGKHLTGFVPVLMVVWGRYVTQTVFVSAVLAHRTGLSFLKTRRPLLQILRGGSLLMATLLMYTALSRVPLADATATLFLSPILVTVFSVLFLGERIGIHRTAAVLLGFVGVLLIVRPGSGAADPAILFAVAAAVFNSAYLLLTRRLAGADDAASTQFNTTAVGAAILTAIVVPVWQTPEPAVLALMAAAGLVGAISHFCLVRAFVHAPASLLSPFLYAQVLVAALFSVVIFGDPLHPAIVAGTAILVASGLYIWWREVRVR